MLSNKSSSAADKTAANEIATDHPLKIRIYKNGRIEQVLRSPFVPASEDPGNTGVASRDVVIDREAGVAARLFLPTGAVAAGRRLPLVLFFHGGSFAAVAAESAFCRTYHRYATSLAARARALVVSVEYRLVPEHAMTAAYDDAWTALRWAASSADPWLLYHADRRCTFVAGDGAGGDIAYHTAVRASRDGEDIDIEGLLTHPSLLLGTRVAHTGQCHGGFLTTPQVAATASLPCRRALVAVAGKQGAVREPGRRSAARMRGCWWRGELTIVELNGEDHGFFHMYGPASASTERLMDIVVEFVNKEEHDQGSIMLHGKKEVAQSFSNGPCKAVSAEVPRGALTKSCL
ncbi:putative carboxylesterase 12 [Panicum miliaceum]|uniref:Carboxylesterase 12 n=1 Tax=Panicum miliaceum TaxID=4540 RepID=A0A3L6PF31_PANMI|nr:putative carboxylesterase 12 [Panicum miliaceum]